MDLGKQLLGRRQVVRHVFFHSIPAKLAMWHLWVDWSILQHLSSTTVLQPLPFFYLFLCCVLTVELLPGTTRCGETHPRCAGTASRHRFYPHSMNWNQQSKATCFLWFSVTVFFGGLGLPSVITFLFARYLSTCTFTHIARCYRLLQCTFPRGRKYTCIVLM